MIKVQKIQDYNAAYKIAGNNPDYFNKQGLVTIKKDIPNQTVFGAWKENTLTGFVSYKEISIEAIELTWMAILPVYQNQGIGTELVKKSLEEMSHIYKVCEVKTLSDTCPDPGYKRTRKFYKRLGFIPLETIHPYPGWGNENPCQIFVKFLK